MIVRYTMETKSCIARITEETYAQKFGNGRNKFYIEFRCHGACIRGLDVCARCAEKSADCKIQTSRRFAHGNVNEPISPESHLFGSLWYEENVRKYGAPNEEVLQFALEHQRKARNGFPPLPAVTAPSPSPAPAPAPAPAPVAPKKPAKKYRVPTENVEEKTAEGPTTVKADPPKPKKAATAKGSNSSSKTVINPYSALIQSSNQMVYKEVSIPTHLESSLEQFDTDGFQMEYVTLKPFEHNGSLYFYEGAKHKLYKNIKQKIGDYVGRYDSEREEIRTDIPDSDDEGEDE
jgi:hypothetical protein